MRAVRLWIEKEGRARYISHLDMNRCFTRAVRRAKLNLWYTEGFNPHPYLNFLTPLSLGQESDGEPLDIRMEDDLPNAEITRRMNEVLPEGLRVVRTEDAVFKASDIAFAAYTIRVPMDAPQEAEAFRKAAADAVLRGSLTAEKLGKQGRHKVMKTVDISGKIHAFSVAVRAQTVVIETTLPAGSDMLNPSLLMDALQKETQTPLHPRIRRNAFYKADGSIF